MLIFTVTIDGNCHFLADTLRILISPTNWEISRCFGLVKIFIFFFGIAAHFDYDPEWTNEKRVFEISANQKDRSQNAQQSPDFFNGVSLLPVITALYCCAFWLRSFWLAGFQILVSDWSIQDRSQNAQQDRHSECGGRSRENLGLNQIFRIVEILRSYCAFFLRSWKFFISFFECWIYRKTCSERPKNWSQ